MELPCGCCRRRRHSLPATQVHVVLDRAEEVYFVGQLLKGNVIVDLEEPLLVTGESDFLDVVL